MATYSYEGKIPHIARDAFLAPDCTVLGDVTIGECSSIWYQCVLRGDVHSIRVGKYTNIQDGSICHVTTDKYRLLVGDYVTVGHGVVLHGCTIEDFTLIGMRAVILDNAVVGRHSIVGAGSVVREGFQVPEGHLVAGVPAKIIRQLSPSEINHFQQSAEHYFELAQKHQKSVQKLQENG